MTKQLNNREQDRFGSTSVTLSQTLVEAFDALEVKATGFGGTKLRNGVADFLITGGSADLDTAKVEIIHSGGLKLTTRNTRVRLTDFIISNLGDRTVLTGLVIVNGDLVARVPLFNLQVDDVEASAEKRLTNLDIRNVGITLTNEAAETLNQVFNVGAFQEDLSIGTANVDALVTTATGDIREIKEKDRQSVIEVKDSLNDHHSVIPKTTLDVKEAGKTRVALSTDLVNALETLNVQAQGFGGTQIKKNGVADFLITGGAADLEDTEVELIHRGGLTLKSTNTAVDLTDFIISNLDDRTVLTGLVTVNKDLKGRAPLFDLQIGNVDVSKKGASTNLNLTNVDVSLSSEAATALNNAFSVSAFQSGLNVGMAQVGSVLV